MRTFYSLTKRQFLGMTKFNKFLYGNSKEKKVFAYTFLAIGLTAIILFFCWFRMAFQICMTFQYPQEIFKFLLKPFVVVSIFMTFLSALIKGSGILYLDKSIDLLFSYPIKTKTIVLSKLSYIYIWNVGISFLLLIVPLLYYDSLQKGNILFYVVDFLQIFLIPLVPTLVGVLLGNVLYRRLGNLFRAGSYSKSILYLVSFTVFFAFMIFFFRYVDFSTLLKGAIAKFDFFNETEKGLLFSHNYKSLIFFAISISLGIILSAYVIQTYKKNCAKVQLYSEKSKCIKMSYKKHEKVSALFCRELKRYFSTPVYLLNTMLGIVSLVLLTIYSYLKIDTVTMYLKLIGMSFKVENTSILLAFVIGLLIILSNVTYASISIEGKQRELLKSYPISIQELLLAKYLFHLSLTVPMIFICATLLGIVCRMNVSEYCLLFLLPTVFSEFVGALGLLINLVFPNYEWENVTYIVKQSISAIITILLSVLIVGGSLWIVLYFFHTYILFASYILAFLFVLLTMLIGILLKKASKTF
ncbi:MAG: hypothetical protein ACLSVM_14235 [Coprococcus phoceensis]